MKINKLYNKETKPINHWTFDKFIDYEVASKLKEELNNLFELKNRKNGENKQDGKRDRRSFLFI